MARTVNLANLQQFTAVNLLSDPGQDPVLKPIPNCIEVRIDWALEGGGVAHNVLHGRVASGFNPTVAIAEAVRAGITSGGAWTTFAAFLATSSLITAVALRDKRSLNTAYISSSGASVPGTSASPALPREVAAVETFRTAITGPGGRGRMYVPGFATNALGAGNVIAAACGTAMNAWVGLVFTTMTAQGLTPCLALPSRVAYIGSTGRQHPARDATTADVTIGLLRDNHWDSQRRRGLK